MYQLSVPGFSLNLSGLYLKGSFDYVISLKLCLFELFEHLVIMSLLKEKNIFAETENYAISSQYLVKKYGVGKTQINDIMKNKSELNKKLRKE